MFGFLGMISKAAKWSDDPNQRRLALMIFNAAIYESSGNERGKPLDKAAVMALTRDAGWSDKESADRCVHALSLIKPIADKTTYRAARDEGNKLCSAYSGSEKGPGRKAA
jgi:hypothetical protein